MPAKSSAPPLYAVNRLNWQRTDSGFVRLPGEFRVASFATQEQASVARKSSIHLPIQSVTRCNVNKKECVPEGSAFFLQGAL